MSFSVAKKAAQKRLARPNTLNDSADSSFLNPKKPSNILASNPLYIVHYTDKSFVVLGDTLNHSEALVRLGGTFNPHLRIGQGWLFSKVRQASVQKYIDTGEVEPYQYTQEQVTKFNNKEAPKAVLVQTEKFSDERVRSMFKEFREAFDPNEDYEGASIIDVIRQLEEKYFNELIITVPVQEKPSKPILSKEEKEAKEERRRQREQAQKLESIANMAMINNIVTEKNTNSQSSIVANLITEMKRDEERRRQQEEDRRRQEEEAKQQEDDRQQQEDAQQESEPLIKFDDIEESPTPEEQPEPAQETVTENNESDPTDNNQQQEPVQTPVCAKFTELVYGSDNQTRTVQCVYIDLEKNIDVLSEFSELLNNLDSNKELWEKLGSQFKIDISGIPGTAVDYMIKFIAELATQNNSTDSSNHSVHQFVAGSLDIGSLITSCKDILKEDPVNTSTLAQILIPLMSFNGGLKAFLN